MTLLQFCYRRHDSPSKLPKLSDDPPSFLFGALVENKELDTIQDSAGNSVSQASVVGQRIFESSFLLSSEHGFTMTPQLIEAQRPLKCTVPGTFGALGFRLHS